MAGGCQFGGPLPVPFGVPLPYTFTPPTYTILPVNVGPLLSRFKQPRAYSVLKTGGVYTTVATPDGAACAAADIVYLGGHTYDITDDEAADLIVAGYTPTLE